MQSIYQIIDDAPDFVSVPEAMRRRRLELIFRPLDEQLQTTGSDARGWPPGFFEQFAGCLAEDPITRPEQGEYEERLALL